ncbi:uncharacterized protein LOC111412531 [Olea europaea var. sylvestris]|uniref:uncharacterized protein LOC111412531 n=1 Tax=Olea europaea var. sylvestris TaxID=158386 RepID=UPI000C1D1AD7|nr:uncharacterized protein LOC111412531 [Olea europaea var. sylvestris]
MMIREHKECAKKRIKYLETFKVAPNWKSKLIIKVVRDDLKLVINRVTAWRARRLAKILIEGSKEHQFGLLWSFAHETLRSNPGSTCIVTTHESKFQGIYLCLEACKRGFMSGCRQLLGLDGCFLKGNFGGQMLVAVALDANDCIYPVAYAIVETENARSWRWFVSHLGEDLRIVNSNEWTFMTGRQKGLQKSKSHFSTKVKSDIVLNNLCEVFNNVVLEDREKSVLTLLIDMNISCMKRIQSRRDKMRIAKGPLCPKIQKNLGKSMEIAEECEVEWRWDLTGIPCGHGVAVILDRGDNPIKYVHECYTVQTYLQCYKNIVNPINGKKLWSEVNTFPLQPPG